ncbi:hypothetical protein SKAU_G00344310 [Synaphobranchus kaupii]|uniref:Uncharacterized protein n=1 Tax=Synaphobranchus kaupii TaxID=118154 RepID=A0A9Q1EJC3_SYNKA|nr:hypothetical protein SKAU_G00344310 [Synaphobranchus kaupii]
MRRGAAQCLGLFSVAEGAGPGRAWESQVFPRDRAGWNGGICTSPTAHARSEEICTFTAASHFGKITLILFGLSANGML